MADSPHAFDERGARRIVNAVRRVERMAPTVGAEPAGGGRPLQKFWAELTGESGGFYSWKKVWPTATGFVDAAPSMTGTNNAREVNSTTGVPSGVRVEMRLVGYSGTAPRYLFQAVISDMRWNSTTKKIQVSYGGTTWVDKVTFTPCP